MKLMFYFSSLVAVLATLRVVMHTQPVRALLYLVVSLLSIACVFFSLGAYFAGALEIIIYAGAIVVLFVFVVMMLNVGTSFDKQERVWLHPRVWIGPSFMALMLLTILIYTFVDSDEDQNITGQILSAKTVGMVLFGPYVLIVELASMLLLAGLVVAFHLGHRKC